MCFRKAISLAVMHRLDVLVMLISYVRRMSCTTKVIKYIIDNSEQCVCIAIYRSQVYSYVFNQLIVNRLSVIAFSLMMHKMSR